MTGVRDTLQNCVSLLLSVLFHDVHNLVLEDKKIGSILSRQANHILVVVFDPTAHRLAIHQLHADLLLLLAQRFEETGFFEGFFRRRGPSALGGVGASLRTERHASIVQERLSAVVASEDLNH